MFEMMATETNLYATQQQEAKGKEDKYWKEVSAADMKVFVAIKIMMGIHVLPEYSMYWSRDDRLNVPRVADVMGKSRYEKISQYLHLNDYTKAIPRGEDGHDPLYKVRPVIDKIRMRASELYEPGTSLSINEAMIAYTGRLHFKQYIKAKPTPWGIKVWCIADPRNGYMLDIDVYTGRTSTPMPHGVGHHVVMRIGEQFLDKNHHFYFDNYFASVKLAKDLLASRTYCCSTIRIKGGVLTVAIPTSILLYNTHMFGVDLADQLRSYYAVGRSEVKWWLYMFWFVIQLSFMNGWNLFRAAQRPYPSNARQFSHLKFRLDVLFSTRGRECLQVQRGVASAGKGSSLSTDHQQCRLVGHKAACYWCSHSGHKTNSGRTSETVFGFTLCKVRMHNGLCFAGFHGELGRAQE